MDPLAQKEPKEPGIKNVFAAKPAAPAAPTPVANQYIRTFQQDIVKATGVTSTPSQRTSAQQRPTFAEPKDLTGLEELPPVQQFKNPFNESSRGVIDITTKKQDPSKPGLATIRTYSGDVAEAVKGGASLTKIATAESDRRAKIAATGKDSVVFDERDTVSPFKDQKNWIILGASLFLLIGGGYGIYRIIAQEEAPQVIVETPKDLVASEKTVSLVRTEKTADAWASKIRRAIEGTELSTGEVAHVRLVSDTTELSTQRFFQSLELTVPGNLSRSLESTMYLGVHAIHGSQPFALFRVNSFENALAGMLAWESAMIKDLQSIFLKDQDRVRSPFFTVAATGKPYSFEDGLLQNRDVRLIKNAYGEPIFMYIFLDRNTLLITTDETTVQEIADRLVKARFVR